MKAALVTPLNAEAELRKQARIIIRIVGFARKTGLVEIVQPQTIAAECIELDGTVQGTGTLLPCPLFQLFEQLFVWRQQIGRFPETKPGGQLAIDDLLRMHESRQPRRAVYSTVRHTQPRLPLLEKIIGAGKAPLQGNGVFTQPKRIVGINRLRNGGELRRQRLVGIKRPADVPGSGRHQAFSLTRCTSSCNRRRSERCTRSMNL